MSASGAKRPFVTFFITLIGLVVAFSVALLCFIFVRSETGFDQFVPRVEDTFRVNLTINPPGSEAVSLPTVTAVTAQAILNNAASAESVTRITREQVPVVVGDVQFQQAAYVVDDNFLEFFGGELRLGHKVTALNRPGAVVLANELAERIFGGVDPLGASIQIGRQAAQVTGVLEDWPATSHLQPQMLISSSSGFTKLAAADAGAAPGEFLAHTYVRARPGSGLELEQQIRALPGTAPLMPAPQAEALKPALDLVGVSDIHLRGLPAGELSMGGNRTLVLAIGVVGLLMLIVTCLNYSILVSADAERRIQEIGVRKAFGATPVQILQGFALRTVGVAAAAGSVAAACVALGLPTVNEQLASTLGISWPIDILAIAGFPLAVALVALIALGLSNSSAINAHPVAALHGELRRRGAGWRTLAAAAQFAISIVLVALTVIIAGQVSLAVDRSLNIGDDDVLIVDGLQQPFPQPSRQTLAEAMRSTPGVIAVGLSDIVPTNFSTALVGLMNAAAGQAAPSGFASNSVDAGFFEAYGLAPIVGSTFRLGTEEGGANEIVLTSSSSAALGFTSVEEAVGQPIAMASPSGMVPFVVIGVVPDIVMKSIEGTAEPAVFTKLGDRGRFLSVRFRPSSRTSVIATLNDSWSQLSAEPVLTSFLRDRLAALYEPLNRAFRFFLGLAAAALVTAGLGIFGAASFTAERRIKEMGLRKALGASSLDVAGEMMVSIAKPLLFAALLAIPVSYSISQWWLSGFVQRITLTPLPFGIALLVAALVGLLSAGAQTIKLAATSPAAALRREQ